MAILVRGKRPFVCYVNVGETSSVRPGSPVTRLAECVLRLAYARTRSLSGGAPAITFRHQFANTCPQKIQLLSLLL
jgi:hypothetical protein